MQPPRSDVRSGLKYHPNFYIVVGIDRVTMMSHMGFQTGPDRDARYLTKWLEGLDFRICKNQAAECWDAYDDDAVFIVNIQDVKALDVGVILRYADGATTILHHTDRPFIFTSDREEV